MSYYRWKKYSKLPSSWKPSELTEEDHQKMQEEYFQKVEKGEGRYISNIDTSDAEFEKKLKIFYKSEEWKEKKKEVYQNLYKMCCVCGSEEKLVVDHIKPLRFFWEERLNIENLQILCDECNLEKGSMRGWTKEWHIKNKDYIHYNFKREQYEYYKKKPKKIEEKQSIFPQRWVEAFSAKEPEFKPKIHRVTKDGKVIKKNS